MRSALLIYCPYTKATQQNDDDDDGVQRSQWWNVSSLGGLWIQRGYSIWWVNQNLTQIFVWVSSPPTHRSTHIYTLLNIVTDSAVKRSLRIFTVHLLKPELTVQHRIYYSPETQLICGTLIHRSVTHCSTILLDIHKWFQYYILYHFALMFAGGLGLHSYCPTKWYKNWEWICWIINITRSPNFCSEKWKLLQFCNDKAKFILWERAPEQLLNGPCGENDLPTIVWVPSISFLPLIWGQVAMQEAKQGIPDIPWGCLGDM